MKVDRVHARPLKNGNWQYVAIAPNGTEEIIRKSATRLYQFAFLYCIPVRNVSTPLSDSFSFGKKPDPSYRDQVLNVFPIWQENQ